VTTTTATKDKKERESDGHVHTHTHAHQHQHHQNGTRDEVKKKEDRQTKKNGTQERNLVVEQWTKDPHKFSHSSQKIASNKKEKLGKAREKKQKQTNDWLVVASVGLLRQILK
jgi:hypothetical protein